jgi:hypothetical protein
MLDFLTARYHLESRLHENKKAAVVRTAVSMQYRYTVDVISLVCKPNVTQIPPPPGRAATHFFVFATLTVAIKQTVGVNPE